MWCSFCNRSLVNPHIFSLQAIWVTYDKGGYTYCSEGADSAGHIWYSFLFNDTWTVSKISEQERSQWHCLVPGRLACTSEARLWTSYFMCSNKLCNISCTLIWSCSGFVNPSPGRIADSVFWRVESKKLLRLGYLSCMCASKLSWLATGAKSSIRSSSHRGSFAKASVAPDLKIAHMRRSMWCTVRIRITSKSVVQF